MRLVFPLVLVAITVLVGWPAGTGQMLDDTRLDLAVALICCVVVIGGVWAARRRRTQLVSTAATLVGWLLLLGWQTRQGGSWPLTTSWVVTALGGLLLSRAGRWEGDQARLLAAGACVVGATLSPFVQGVEGGLMVPTVAVIGGASLGLGAMVRGQAMTLRRARVEVRDRERHAMAHELHDVIAHEITGVVVLAQAVQAATHEPTVREAVGRIEVSAQRALNDIRALVASWRDDERGGAPTQPARAGLDDVADLVETYRATTSATVTLTREGDGELSAATAGAALRIVAEALTNVRRHAASATLITVGLDARSDQLVVDVHDNGPGVSGGSGIGGGTGWGLAGIAERADLIGGTVESGPAPDGGWRVHARLPRRAAPSGSPSEVSR